MNYITLNNGVKIPQIGLGVFRTPDGADTANAVKWAIEAGYRHIDTAKVYGNEKSVGEGIRMSVVDRRVYLLQLSFGMRILDREELKKHFYRPWKTWDLIT